MITFDFTSSSFEKWKYLELNRKTRGKTNIQNPELGKIKVDFVCDDGKEYSCIYYHKTKEEVYDKIKSGESIDLNYSYVKDFNITRAVSISNRKLRWFSAGFSFWDGSANFEHCDFVNPFTDFKGANFCGENVNFSSANFKDTFIDFTCANFESEEVDFVGVKFGDRGCVFSKANFGNSRVSFDEAQFSKGAKAFDKITLLNGILRFFAASFGDGSLIFDFANLEESKVYLDSSIFEDGLISFENANVEKGILSFKETRLKKSNLSLLKVDAKQILFDSVKFENYTDLRIGDVEELIIENCIVEKAIVFNSIDTNIKKMSLAGTINLGLIYIDWDKNNVKKAIKEYSNMQEGKKGRIKEKRAPRASRAEQYKMLKENFKSLGNYDDEEKAYREYMKNKTLGFPGSILRIFGPIGSYGTKPFSILLFSALIVVVFGLGYNALGAMPALNAVFTNPIISSVYYSAVSFLTMGIGSAIPQSQAVAVLSVFEGFIGLVLMIYFTISLVRKIFR
jgi:hypothetical protein